MAEASPPRPVPLGDQGRPQDHAQSHDYHGHVNPGTNQVSSQAAAPATAAARLPRPRQPVNNKNKKQVKCRYFATKQGCRAGEACPFSHVSQTTINEDVRHRLDDEAKQIPSASGQEGNLAQAPEANQSVGTVQPPPVIQTVRPVQQVRAVVSRPIPKAQIADPREFQIGQIMRRFAPEVNNGNQGTSLTFLLKPSDPDFPFELDGLRCTLLVPPDCPIQSRPTLRISNPEMERGYQINVERGFDSLVDQAPHRSLLSLMNELDKNLEQFLTSEKAQTVKIVAHVGKKVGPELPADTEEIVTKPITTTAKAVNYTEVQKAEARAKRDAETRQLEARLGRQPLFSKSSDSTSFNVPLQIPKPGRLPVSLQSLKDITLLVPLLYNLDPCTIVIKGAQDDEAQSVEHAFERRARQQPGLSLMAHINHLAQNMHVMVHESEKISVETLSKEDSPAAVSVPPKEVEPPNVPSVAFYEESKSHIVVIPRPPEWSMPHDHSENKDEDEDSSDPYDSEEAFSDDEDGGIPVPPEATSQGPETGIMLSFPLLELYGIELLKLASASLTVKCDRCKTTADMRNIQPQTATSNKRESCNKCANTMTVGFRGDLMHTNSIRAGYFDLDGCTVVDLLPSNFIPTCAECSTDHAAPGVVAVRGDTSVVMCRECHHKMSFKLPEVRFLRVSSAAHASASALPRKKAKENLGITAGQELPKRGRCRHYQKSYRWFRFGCCNKVYACDRCHDEVEEHPNEHAPRMICGFCSREQAYRPEECGLCHGSLVGRKGGGFWEGGKGTRDKVRMSRKDPRKFKRVGGGAPVGGVGKGKGKGK